MLGAVLREWSYLVKYCSALKHIGGLKADRGSVTRLMTVLLDNT